MAETAHIINALPLIADVLGRKYGVRVFVGGNKAYTNGKDIHIPALPMDAEETVLNLARGFLDHEAAHLRITDFEALEAASLTEIEKRVWNIIEDYMVEKKLAQIYPGCKENFIWLIRHIFPKKNDSRQNDDSLDANNIFNWLLIGLRAFSVPELACECERLGLLVDRDFPGLRSILQRLVQTIPDVCENTVACIDTAKQIVDILKNYIREKSPNDERIGQKGEAGARKSQTGTENHKTDAKSSVTGQTGNNCGEKKNSPHVRGDAPCCQSEVSGNCENLSCDSDDENKFQRNCAIKALDAVLKNPSILDEKDIGNLAGKILEDINNTGNNNQLTVAIQKPFIGKALSGEEINDIRQKANALRTRLSALLQAKVLVRNHIGHTGKIDCRKIAALAVGNARVFARHNQKQGSNTAVHILLDASSSMNSGNRMLLASHACFAISDALYKLPGVGVAVSVFPSGSYRTDGHGEISWTTVAPVLAYKQKMHRRFQIPALGGTPMAEALWWVLQQMHQLRENRKILLILSDGDPDNVTTAKNAIRVIQQQGIEVYGIGIQTEAINRLLPDKYAQSVYDLAELAKAMFELLQKSLLIKGGLKNETAA